MLLQTTEGNMLKHGSETLVKDYDSKNIIKTPLARAVSKRQTWMTGQRSAADTMQKLSEMSNGAYIIPKTELIDTDNFCVVEERIDGVPLTPLLFRAMDDDTRNSILNSLAQFYADMHRIHPVENTIKYQMRYGFQVDYLNDFIQSGMRQWFPMSDVHFVERVCRDLKNTDYETRLVWAHNDLFDENVLYNAHTRKCAIIDFTKTGYSFLHYDVIDSYANDLGVFDDFRTRYLAHRSNDNLPDNFTDNEKWNKILNWHRAAQILTDIEENARNLRITKDANSAVVKMRTNIEILRNSWSR